MNISDEIPAMRPEIKAWRILEERGTYELAGGHVDAARRTLQELVKIEKMAKSPAKPRCEKVE